MSDRTERYIGSFQSAQSANTFLYFLSHAVIFRKFFHEDLVMEYEAKEGIKLALESLRWVGILIKKCIYLYILMAIGYQTGFNMAFLLVYLAIPSLAVRNIIELDDKAYNMVMLLHYDCCRYARYQILRYLFRETVSFVIVLGVFAALTDISYPLLLIHLGGYLSIHIIGEYLYLESCRRKQFILKDSVKESVIRLLTSLLLTALPALGLIVPLHISKYVSGIFAAAIMIPAALALYRIAGFEGYKKLFRHNLSIEKPLSGETVSNGQVHLNITEMNKNISEKEIVTEKTGYAYIFELFLQRYRKSFLRPLIIKIVLITIAGLLMNIVPQIMPEFRMTDMGETIYSSIGLLIYGIYYLSNSSKQFVLTSFMQIDRYLINYSFFRRADGIRKNFLLRFRALAGITLLPALLVSLFLGLFYFLYSEPVMISHLLAIILFPNVLATFFAVYNLSVYYLMQPYDFNGTIVNKAYAVTDYLIYLACYIAMVSSVELSLPVIVAIALVLTVVSVVLFIIVVKRSPKFFRVR